MKHNIYKNCLLILSWWGNMRILIITILAVLLLSSSAIASHLFLEGIRLDQEVAQGEPVFIRVEMDTQGDEDIRVRASIPELGIYRTAGPFDADISKGKSTEYSRTLILEPEDIESGEYWVRISIKTDDRKIVKYRPLIIY